MEYYESDRPPVDDSGLSGGVLFGYGGVIATATSANQISGGGGGSDSGGNNTPEMETYTIQICIDGVVKNLDVYVSGAPY